MLTLAVALVAVSTLAFLADVLVDSRQTPATVRHARRTWHERARRREQELHRLSRDLRRLQTERGALVDEHGGHLFTFGKVRVYERWIQTPAGSGPLTGRVATYMEDASSSRFTFTRLFFLRIFALAFKKKTGALFLVVDHPGFVHMERVHPRERVRATKVTGRIRDAARKADAIHMARPASISKIDGEIAHVEARLTEADKQHREVVARAALDVIRIEGRYGIGGGDGRRMALLKAARAEPRQRQSRVAPLGRWFRVQTVRRRSIILLMVATAAFVAIQVNLAG